MIANEGTEQDLSITVALAYQPVPYAPDWWSASSRNYDYLGQEGGIPWSKMPKAVIMASLEDTLAAVLDRAGEALGVTPGLRAKEAMTGGSERLSSMLFSIGFYRPHDEDGFDVQHSYRWKNRLPAVDVEGNVTYHPCHEVTYQQLFVSARAGLIEGDVRRAISEARPFNGSNFTTSTLEPRTEEKHGPGL